jgi:hypothetical protein
MKKCLTYYQIKKKLEKLEKILKALKAANMNCVNRTTVVKTQVLETRQ